MAVTYALSTEITYKAGANVNSTYTGAGYLEKFGYLAEGVINVSTRYNWSAWYTSYGATYPTLAYILVEAAACKAAIDVINADMSGFTNIQEATSRINVLTYFYEKALAILKEEAVKGFLRSADGVL